MELIEQKLLLGVSDCLPGLYQCWVRAMPIDMYKRRLMLLTKDARAVLKTFYSAFDGLIDS